MKQLYLLLVIFFYACDTHELTEGIEDADYIPFEVSYNPLYFDVDTTYFEFSKSIKVVNAIEEASGLAQGRVNLDCYYTHNDRGHSNIVYLYNSQAEQLGRFRLGMAWSIDYEDISNFTSQTGEHFLYVGDFGDNPLNRDWYEIHYFKEPEAPADKDFYVVLDDVKTIKYKYLPSKEIEETYPNYDCEAMFVEPETNHIYLFTKAATNCLVYRINYPFLEDEQNEAEYLGKIKINGQKVTAADISKDGTKILIKTYETVFYWERDHSESIVDLLQTEPLRVPYVGEVQGEAICFTTDGGYLTTSEKDKNVHPSFNFYKQK